MNRFALSAALLVSCAASAAPLDCSIHPLPGTQSVSFDDLADVSQVEAQTDAVAGMPGTAASVTDAALEITGNDCLVYAFDIRVDGQPGADHVLVDAGTGRVLARTHESDDQLLARRLRH